MAFLARLFFGLAFVTFVVGCLNRFLFRDYIWFIENITFVHAASALALLGILCGVIHLIALQEQRAQS